MNHIIQTLSAVLLLFMPATVLHAQNTVTAEATTVTEGEEWTLNVSLANTTKYVTFQADIAVPEGVTLKDGSLTPSDRLNGHTVTATTLGDGTIRIVAYNGSNTTLLGSSGTLFTITLIASSVLTNPEAKAIFRNMRFTNTALEESLLKAFTVALPVPEIPTGISTATLTTGSAARIYDLQGRSVISPKRGGIYIINGKKTLIR